MPKRRANGEGNIRKRKDGRWEGRYTVGHDPETGKAIIKNVLGKTQAEVKEKLKKAIEENVGIDYGRAKNYTVGNWLEVWYENYAKIKMRPSTYLTYHGYIENHIKPQLGKIPLNDLTTLHLQQFYKKLLAEGRVERIGAQKQPKGLSAKTVRNIHQIISSALKLAVEQRLIARNPADGCALPKAERKEMQTLPVEQLTSFLREAKDSGVFGYSEATLKEIGMYHMMKESAVEKAKSRAVKKLRKSYPCLLYTSPSPRDGLLSRMPSSA